MAKRNTEDRDDRDVVIKGERSERIRDESTDVMNGNDIPSPEENRSGRKRTRTTLKGDESRQQTPRDLSSPVESVPIVYKDVMFSNSEYECQIAEFGHVLDEMLTFYSKRDYVQRTAAYMRLYPQHALRFQIKMKQRANGERTKLIQSKLMLIYAFHEFLKSFQGEELHRIQRDWYSTVDEIIHAYVRDVKGKEDFRNRLIKTLARWEELNIYTSKLKQWKSIVMMETKPRRAVMRLPRTEAERLAEVPDQLQQFPPPPNTSPIQLTRVQCPFLFEHENFRTNYDLKQHWRYTSIAFIEILGQCLVLGQEITLTACMFFHRVFDRGIYKQERFKYAAACIFLSAKAASKRMKLIRMVKTMHEILELPLLYGDEEVLDLERMQLLYYEMEVLKGIEFELATELPFKYLRQTLEQMPEKFRRDVDDAAHKVLEDLFWLPLCLSTRPAFLAEAAAYIACRNKDRIFSFRWCREDKDGQLLTEKAAKDILKDYRHLMTWKKDQQRHFKDLIRSAPSSTPEDLQQHFAKQRGGLRVDVSMIMIKSEFTKKGENESKDVLSTYVPQDTSRERRNDSHRKYSPSRRRESRIKDEDSRRSDYDRRDRSDCYESTSRSTRHDYNHERESSRKRRDDDYESYSRRSEVKREEENYHRTKDDSSRSRDKKRYEREDSNDRSRSQRRSEKERYRRKSPSRSSSRHRTSSSRTINKRRRSTSSSHGRDHRRTYREKF